MKILIINIALRPNSNVIYAPLGLTYIASAARRSGYEFDFMDIDADRHSASYIDRQLEEKQYDVVCVGCIVTGYKYVKDLAGRVKKAKQKTVIIAGNSVASSIPDLLLTKTEVDIAVIGEGDVTIVELLSALEQSKPLRGIKSICYKKDGRVMRNAPRPVIKDIDSIAFPDWSMLNMEKYIESCSKHGASDPLPLPRKDIRAFAISTARGCPFQCTFCYHVFKGSPYRYHSSEVIVKEIEKLKNKYDLNYLIFHDDLSLVNKTHAKKLAECLLDKNVDIFWVADSRTDLFQDEKDIKLAELLKKSGCVGLAFSLENTDANILEMMNKKVSPDAFSKQCRILSSAGIACWTSLVFGYPIETRESIKATVDCCAENGIYPSAGYLLPLPATQVYDYAREKGFIKDEEEYLLNISDRQDFQLNMTNMSDQEFQGAVLDGLSECSKRLKLNLEKTSLTKTGYYRSMEKNNVK